MEKVWGQPVKERVMYTIWQKHLGCKEPLNELLKIEIESLKWNQGAYG